MALSRRKSAAVALAVVGVAGLSLASAAQLSISNSSLGAGNSIVTSCQPDGTPITVGFTPTFKAGTSAPESSYTTSVVNLKGIAGTCANQKVNLTVVDKDGKVLATAAELTLPATPAATTAVAIPATSTAAIGGVSVVISN